jgi:hypothetical protein
LSIVVSSLRSAWRPPKPIYETGREPVNTPQKPAFTDAELAASLRGLGLTELEQRLEFSPLLAGSTIAAGDTTEAASVCCSCKMPPDDVFGDGDSVLPSDPTPGDTFWGTGPTDGLGGR